MFVFKYDKYLLFRIGIVSYSIFNLKHRKEREEEKDFFVSKF
jgi:hypothetical protein